MHRVISSCGLSSQGSGKIRGNHQLQSLAKEDHADPCMGCLPLEMKPEVRQNSRYRWNTSLRKLRWRGSGGMNFRHGLAPGSEKVTENDIVF